MSSRTEKNIAELRRKQKWNASCGGRASRWVMFKLGFSRCQFCINCRFDGQPYRPMREDVVISDGECLWSKESPSSRLMWTDLTTFHRCPGFVEVLYNIKDYAIDPEEIRKIRDRRTSALVTVAGWVVAVVVALVTVWLESRK